MALGRCTLRFLLVAVNVMFFIISVAFVLLGTYIQRQRDTYLPDFTPSNLWAPWILFSMAGIVAISSCMGCHAAALENKCIMLLYGAIMLTLTIIMTTMAGIVYTHTDQIKSEMADVLFDRLLTYGIQDARYKQSWDSIMKDLGCCGIHSYQDWIKNPLLEGKQAVPDSCCLKTIEDCGIEKSAMIENEAANTIFVDGCLLKLTHMLYKTSTVSAAITIMAATIFAATILTTFFIVCEKKPAKEATELISMETLE